MESQKIQRVKKHGDADNEHFSFSTDARRNSNLAAGLYLYLGCLHLTSPFETSFMSLGCQASHNQQGKVRKKLSEAYSIKPNLFVKNKLSGITKVKYQAVGLADVVLT